MAKDLTERQKRVVDSIKAWIREHGYPPTIRELGKQLGIKSLRGVTTHLDAIAKKGHLSRHRAARGIRLLGGAPAGSDAVRVPVVGRIAAGKPVLADECVEGQLLVDASLFGKGWPADSAAKHFALQVHGMSMQGAGIVDGDYVVVRQQTGADNGDIVAVLIDDEATVKRFFQERDHIRLQPEHPTMAPIILRPEQSASVLGKVVAVFRRVP